MPIHFEWTQHFQAKYSKSSKFDKFLKQRFICRLVRMQLIFQLATNQQSICLFLSLHHYAFILHILSCTNIPFFLNAKWAVVVLVFTLLWAVAVVLQHWISGAVGFFVERLHLPGPCTQPPFPWLYHHYNCTSHEKGHWCVNYCNHSECSTISKG